MKAVFRSADKSESTEMSVELTDDNTFEFWNYDRNDEQASQFVKITFDEAQELIKFLQEKMKS